MDVFKNHPLSASGNRNDWLLYDPKTSGVILVGPMQNKAVSPASLKRAGLEDMPQVAVDGGLKSSVNPVLWTGDGDSGFVPKEIATFFKTDQNHTDLSFCLEGIRDWHWRELHLMGFLEGRKDHELAVFGEVYAEMKSRSGFNSSFFYDHDIRPYVSMHQSGKHKVFIEGRFSVLTLEDTIFSISGDCVYKAENIVLRALSGRGVSNQGSGEVTVQADKPFLVIRT